MKKIKVLNWIEQELVNNELIDIHYTTMKILSLLVDMIPPAETPRGLEQFKLYNSIIKKFETVEEKLEENFEEQDIFLYLEDNEYSFFKQNYDKYVPVRWAKNVMINRAFQEFDNAENYDPNIEKKEGYEYVKDKSD